MIRKCITLIYCITFILPNIYGSMNDFPLLMKNKSTNIYIAPGEAQVVKTAATILSHDIYKITGKQLESNSLGSVSIIAGTIGKNKYIKRMVSAGKINVSSIENQWEAFSIQVVKQPIKGVDQALVIVGADRRGTAYGLLEISRMIGVSPWEWWADVTPTKREELIIKVTDTIYQTPSVKYRGIFLNDEDWGLQRWAALNYEPETGDIGPKTYAKVFELLLRLRANTIWPAMHSCTKPFYFYPENKKVADDYGIIIGTSHCEPMLCNINAEWDSESMGEWRYDSNSTTIQGLFNERTSETKSYENIYTIGMRGEHDSPMIVGEDNTDAQVELLEQVVHDQRDILEKQRRESPQEIPQIFIPYKEVLKYYQAGMELPDDVTLVWTDDNYGYIRQLSDPIEQKRKGGAGIYYHTSYWGRPHDYLWLNSSNPVLMWEEMAKAYAFNSRNVWILNCGDIKPHEYNIELFLDMAYNMEQFEESETVRQHMNNWSSREFGGQNANAITDVLYEYYRLAFQRRPEFMAWSQVEPVTKTGQTELSSIHYGDEITQRIEDYQLLLDQVETLNNKIDNNRKDAFYELVYYPVVGAASLNHKWLYTYKNAFAASQKRGSTSYYGEQVKLAYQRILKETNYFNKELKDGKWNHIMNIAPRNLPVFAMPATYATDNQQPSKLGIALESYDMQVNNKIINSYANVLPVFNSYTDSRYFIDLFKQGSQDISWKIVPKDDWITVSHLKGSLDERHPEQRIIVGINAAKAPVGENRKEAPLGHDYQLIPPSYKVNSSIDIITKDTTISIGISLFNPALKELEDFDGFIEDKGFISIHAENAARIKSRGETSWKIIDGLGYTGKVIAPLPYNATVHTVIDDIVAKNPVIEYDFYSFNFGKAKVHLQAVPTHPFNHTGGVRCAVAIDDNDPVIVNFKTYGRSEEWKQNVLRNAARKSVDQVINKAGKHTLKIWMIDPGVMLDQVLIDLGGWKDSYAFPKESKK
ncbi:hypothetical protein EYV94_18205 [Puteibacter caeruleilacunae]|nr:hypothetical protein EYV94_18205 [Puteibacter caeruleilacunae]